MSYYDDMNEMTREGGAPSKDGEEAVSSEHCPDHPDFGLLDKALHGLDGALGGDMLPLDKVVPDVDLLSVVFMAKQRALKVLYEMGAGSGSLGPTWMDGFMAGVMFQRLKAKQTLS